MPRRSRVRLISQKPKKRTARKSENIAEFDEDQDPPSETTWAVMAPYGSFVGVYLTNLRCTSPHHFFPNRIAEQSQRCRWRGAHILQGRFVCFILLSTGCGGPRIKAYMAVCVGLAQL